MSELVERLRKGPVTYKSDNGEFVYAGPDALHRLAAKAIDELTQANAALMAERASLIETKREQIERLTAERDAARADRDSHQREAIRAMEERDAALAKLAQYEQAPVVGWASKVGLDRIAAAQWREHPAFTDLRNWRFDTNKPDDDTALIARPEVTK